VYAVYGVTTATPPIKLVSELTTARTSASVTVPAGISHNGLLIVGGAGGNNPSLSVSSSNGIVYGTVDSSINRENQIVSISRRAKLLTTANTITINSSLNTDLNLVVIGWE
jgi:hypothetical protein